MAKFISKHESLRMVVRLGLWPLVGISWSLLKFGLLPTAIFLLLISIIITYGVYYRAPRDRKKGLQPAGDWLPAPMSLQLGKRSAEL
jgi:hypothetical protein